MQDPIQLHIPGREAGVFPLIKPDAIHLAAATAAAQGKAAKQYIRVEPRKEQGSWGGLPSVVRGCGYSTKHFDQ